jgi:hypothetical protein
VDEEGDERPYDLLCFATGFDTSFKPHFEVVGKGGYRLADADFVDNPRSYMVSCLPNCPNYFVPAGPFLMSINGEFLGGLEKIADYSQPTFR